jgi:hypothetical protein
VRGLFTITVGVVALGLCSCGSGDGRKPTFAVTGQVLDGSKPVANATVVLHPVNESGSDVAKPRGTTKPDGTFTLTTYDGNDGAPAGEYRVTIEQWLAGRPDEGPSSRLPVKFAKPETSGLTATVTAGPTELKPFVVKK